MYGQNSDSNNLVSQRRVKQGDPLGPFLFCVALQSIFRKFQMKFHSLNMCVYADDASLVGSIDDLLSAFPVLIELSNEIGLQLNYEKCFLIGSSPFEFIFEGHTIHCSNYSVDAIKLLGTFIGNGDQIRLKLDKSLEKISVKLTHRELLRMSPPNFRHVP
ncbi:hypothetical protein GEMRC1_003208 [Eukaryota sp. GEM-RC1]